MLLLYVIHYFLNPNLRPILVVKRYDYNQRYY